MHSVGAGILDIINLNASLYPYSGPGHWNDMDMLVIGLYGKQGPSGYLGGTGCTDTEYQTQMSMWCMLNSVLAVTCDLKTMNEATKNIILNKDIIAINQDTLGRQAQRLIHTKDWDVYLRPLANGDHAIAILNRGETANSLRLSMADIGLAEKYEIYDVWAHKTIGKGSSWKGRIQPHETKVFRLTTIR